MGGVAPQVKETVHAREIADREEALRQRDAALAEKDGELEVQYARIMVMRGASGHPLLTTTT